MSLDSSFGFCFYTCQKRLAVAGGWWWAWDLSDQIYISLKHLQASSMRVCWGHVHTAILKHMRQEITKNLYKNTILTWYWPHCPLVIFFLGQSCQLFLARLSPFVFLLLTVFHLLSSLNLLSFHFHFLSSLSSHSCCAKLPCMHGPPIAFVCPVLISLSAAFWGSGSIFLFKLTSYLELPWDLQPQQTAIRKLFSS